ncbi:MAG: hypothetical protein KIT10_04795 [Flavobacteriales bacterium]|nr:hypothetical protein [Flavobacteriales bacterium]
MERDRNYLRTVGGLAILAGLLAAATLIVGAFAVDLDMEAFSDPARTLDHAHNHQLAYWFNILDLFGYYLLMIPLALHLHRQMRYRSPWVPLITLGGVAYALIGSAGAAVLAAVWPDLMREHLTASSDEQMILAVAFRTVTLAVTQGLWNILEVLFAAVWWIGLGLLWKPGPRGLSVLSHITGIACLLDGVGNILGIGLLAELGLNVYLLMGIIWPIAVGMRLMREARGGDPLTID